MGNQQERSLGWLAGIIDGEGSISAQVYTLPDGRVRITPFICVVNTDEGILGGVMEMLTELTEGKRVKPRRCGHGQNRPGGYEGKLVCDIIRVDGRDIRPILEAILPHLRSKKRNNAEVILRYLDLRDAMIFKRDAAGRLERQGYTREQIELVASIRTSPRAKSSEAICLAPNVTG